MLGASARGPMRYRCLNCGHTHDNEIWTCEAPACGFRVGRIERIDNVSSKPRRTYRGGCVVSGLLVLVALVVLNVPSLNQGMVGFLSRELDAVVRWWFRLG